MYGRPYTTLIAPGGPVASIVPVAPRVSVSPTAPTPPPPPPAPYEFEGDTTQHGNSLVPF